MADIEENFSSEFEMQEVIKVPTDRVGVIIGKQGSTKEKLENLTKSSITIDSTENTVTIKPRKDADPGLVWICRDMIQGIARGFSEEKVFKLIDPNVILRIITLEGNKNSKHIQRVKGRIIGENGKARKFIEFATKVNISVYGNTIALIGESEQLDVAQQAIDMLINGSNHTTMYRFLEKYRTEKKAEAPDLWKLRDDVAMERIFKENGSKKTQPVDNQTNASINKEELEQEDEDEDEEFKEDEEDEDEA